MLAMTRKGKQVLNVGTGEEAAMCAPADGDSVAVIGDNRKLLLFPARGAARRCRAARACGSSATRTAASPTPKAFSKKDGLAYIDSATAAFVLDRIARLVGRARPGRAAAAQRLPQVSGKLRPALLAKLNAGL